MRTLVLTVALTLSLVGCTSSETVTEPPAEQMSALAQSVTDTTSLRFQIFFSGPQLTIEEGVILDSIDGQYRSPDAAQAAVRVKALGLTGSIGVLAYGDQVWQRGPVTTDWEEVTADELLTVRDMFAEDGLKAMLRLDVAEVERQGSDMELEDFPGESFTLLTGTVNGDRLARLTLGVLEGGATDIAVYGTSDEIRRIILTETTSEDPRVWTIDLFAYGQATDLEPAP